MALVSDVMNRNAWGVVEFHEDIVREIDYLPQMLGSLNLFEPIYSRTRAIAIAKTGSTLTLIPTSATGEAPVELIPEGADLRYFQASRLAKGSTIYAAQLAGTAALPFDLQTADILAEVTSRAADIKQDAEFTWENMRLGAVLGKVYDADGTTILHDWFASWGVNQSAFTYFELNNPETDVRKKCRDIVRRMQKESKGSWTPATRVGALVGDDAFDMLVNHPQIKETKLGTERAPLLEDIEGYSAIEIENITFINYRGSDNGELAIATDEMHFFPIGARGAFKVGWAPADEFKPYLGRRGEDHYSLLLEDKSGRDAWDRVELYSYPLFMCTRPKMLLRAKAGSNS